MPTKPVTLVHRLPAGYRQMCLFLGCCAGLSHQPAVGVYILVSSPAARFTPCGRRYRVPPSRLGAAPTGPAGLVGRAGPADKSTRRSAGCGYAKGVHRLGQADAAAGGHRGLGQGDSGSGGRQQSAGQASIFRSDRAIAVHIARRLLADHNSEIGREIDLDVSVGQGSASIGGRRPGWRSLRRSPAAGAGRSLRPRRSWSRPWPRPLAAPGRTPRPALAGGVSPVPVAVVINHAKNKGRSVPAGGKITGQGLSKG